MFIICYHELWHVEHNQQDRIQSSCDKQTHTQRQNTELTNSKNPIKLILSYLPLSRIINIHPDYCLACSQHTQIDRQLVITVKHTSHQPQLSDYQGLSINSHLTEETWITQETP